MSGSELLSTSKSKKLIVLLEALKERVLPQEFSRINSSIVDCCDFLIETLGESNHVK